MYFRTRLVWTANRWLINDARFERVLAALTLLFAACVAALAAHLAIDALGDVILAHDSYDHAAHGSRGLAFAAAAFGFLALIWLVVVRALDEAAGHIRSLRRAIDVMIAGSVYVFVGQVAVLAVVVLAAMGLVDVALDKTALNDIADLFGGSLVLGCAVTIPIAVAVASAVWAGLCWTANAHSRIVNAIVALISLCVRADRQLIVAPIGDSVMSPRLRCSGLAKRFGKRAPPPLSA